MSQKWNEDFLASDLSVNDSVTKVDGTDFDSERIAVGDVNKALISLKFKPAVGAAFSIDFEFNVSHDDVTTFMSGLGADSFKQIQINTNVNADAGVVYHSEIIDLHGVTHIKLNRVLVAAGGGNCTEINVNLGAARGY